MHLSVLTLARISEWRFYKWHLAYEIQEERISTDKSEIVTFYIFFSLLGIGKR